MSKKIKVAIIGVGNCASSLVQGVEFYKDVRPGEDYVGLMHPILGGYRPGDIEFTCAFDVSDAKVGRDLSEAIFAKPNNTYEFAAVPHLDAPVYAGPVFDGLASTVEGHFVKRVGREEASIADILKENGTEILINYLPVGSEVATRFYMEEALKAGVAVVNAIPVFIAKDPNWQDKFREKGLPILGDDIKSQVGATIAHRYLTQLFEDRGYKLDRTYQLNVGGNMDFCNMVEGDRLYSKKVSKVNSVVSLLKEPLPPEDVYIGPSDYIPWLLDRKEAFIRMEGRGFGGVPIEINTWMRVWDSPNSAGVMMDAVRCCKIALDRGMAGPISGPSAFFFKSPPVNMTDEEAKKQVADFIEAE